MCDCVNEILYLILHQLHHLPVTVQLVHRLDEISAVSPEPRLLLGDGGLPVAAAEAGDPLEPADTVQGDDQQADVGLPHLRPDQHELVAGVDPVGRDGVVRTTVGDVSDISEHQTSQRALWFYFVVIFTSDFQSCSPCCHRGHNSSGWRPATEGTGETAISSPTCCPGFVLRPTETLCSVEVTTIHKREMMSSPQQLYSHNLPALSVSSGYRLTVQGELVTDNPRVKNKE